MAKRRILISLFIGLFTLIALLSLLFSSRKNRLNGRGLRFIRGCVERVHHQ